MRFCQLLKNVFHAGLGMVNDEEIVNAAVEVLEHFVLTETALKGKEKDVVSSEHRQRLHVGRSM